MGTMTKADIYRNPEASKIASSIGMTVLLVSFAMLFASMLLGYVVFRLGSESWPPMGMEPMPITFPLVSTAMIVLSSLTYSLFGNAYKSKDLKASKLYLLATLALGLGFMASQFELWSQMKEMGYLAETGIFASLIYAFTWVHAAHIVAGIFSLFFMLYFVFKGEHFENMASNIGKFWHFLDIVWGIIFVALFLV